MTPSHNAPTIITIFGGTGNLAVQKLFPALFDLYAKGLLPTRTHIVGFARSEFSDTAYRNYVKGAIRARGGAAQRRILDRFLRLVTYFPGDFTVHGNYERFSDMLLSIEESFGQCTNKLFYLAVAPASFEVIFRNLADSGLTLPCSDETGWTRVLVEKPFGNDGAAAAKLDALLGLLFKEGQIFRIDHYLAKETLQNILTFRFSNLMFEPVWNRTYVEKVEIRLYEKGGVGTRGGFYDGLGALRDVGQNHMLQMLCMVGMDNPGNFSAEHIRAKRIEVLRALKLEDADNPALSLMRGQYSGYRSEKGVAPDSDTETYFHVKAYIDNDRWRGVPFHLESGKGLHAKRTNIVIRFKDSPACLCPEREPHNHKNILAFDIDPGEGIRITFWAKKPRFKLELEPKELSFRYKKTRGPSAYEKILFDGIVGDQVLFTSTAEVSYAWNFIEQVADMWKTLPLMRYRKGGNGLRSSLL